MTQPRHRPSNAWHWLGRCLAGAVTVLLFLTSAPSAAALSAPPSGLRLADRASSGWAVSWTPAKGVPMYRIKYSTKSSMANPVFHRFTDTRGEVTGLKASTTYYVQVKSIATDGASLSRYSKAIKITTRAKGAYSHLYPTGLVAALRPTSISLNWKSRGAGIRYRVAWSSKSTMSNPHYVRTTPAAATISGLRPSTSYWFKVRVIDASGQNLSSYSPVIKATTAKVAAVPDDPLRVGSYNVRCDCASGVGEELPWAQRRDAVARLIKNADLDVVGVQEASQAWLKDANGELINRSQFEDLVIGLGGKWQLVNAKRNNCVNHTTPTNCVSQDQGASKGTRIVYDADRLEVLASGSAELAHIEGRNDRWVAWAVFRQRSTGDEFMFANTHLEHSNDVEGVYAGLRERQAAGVVATVKAHNAAGRPVVVVGDFNSSKWTAPSNGPYDVLTVAGYVDPLGNTYHSTTTAPGATVEHRIRTSLGTFNGFRRTAPDRPDWINGTQIDYIFTTPMRVLEWETVADLDVNGQFRGVIPSDHNLVRASVVLPG